MMSLFGGIFGVIYLAVIMAIAVIVIWLAVLLIKFLQLKNQELRRRLATNEDRMRDNRELHQE